MGVVFSGIRAFTKESSHYFEAYTKEISASNLLLLQRLNVCALILQSSYFVLCIFLFPKQDILLSYAAFLLVYVILWVFTRVYRKRETIPFRTVQTLCTLFLVSVMSFITIISVFPYPDRPAIFFPLFYLLLSSLFIYPYLRKSLLLTGFEVLFLALSFLFKSRVSFSYDLFGSLTAWLMGLLLSYLVLFLHLREGKARGDLETALSTDVTTTLPNRRAYDEYIQSHYRQCAQNGLPMAVLLMDIDNYKAFNDRFGHVAGDECLYQIGKTLRAYSAEHRFFTARYGGEELVSILVGGQADDARRFAKGIKDCVCSTVVKMGETQQARVTASVGIAVQREFSGEETHLGLVRRADEAMYEAKRLGKNRIFMEADS